MAQVENGGGWRRTEENKEEDDEDGGGRIMRKTLRMSRTRRMRIKRMKRK